MKFSRPHLFRENLRLPFIKDGNAKLVLVCLIDRTRHGQLSVSIITAWLYLLSEDEDEVVKVNITKQFKDQADPWIYQKRVMNDYKRTLEKDWDFPIFESDEKEPA